jgi:hypothetical protein
MKSNMFKKLLGAALVAMTLTAASGIAAAETLDKGSTEVLGYVGGMTDNLGGTFGGGIGYAVERRLQVAGELGWVSASGLHGFEFNLNGHYLFPLKNNSKVTPYALAGLGIIHVGNGGSTRGGLNLGGGARLQAGKNWGIQPEFKFFVSNHTYARFSGGIYYTFGK